MEIFGIGVTEGLRCEENKRLLSGQGVVRAGAQRLAALQRIDVISPSLFDQELFLTTLNL